MNLFAVALLLACGCGGDGGSTDGADAAAGADAPPGAGRWEPRAVIEAGTAQETAVVQVGGIVYVLGGFARGVNLSDQVLTYDPGADSWGSAAAMPMAVHHANAAVVDGKIYVVGAMTLSGFNFVPAGVTWVYDPVADDWTELAAMPAGAERGASFVGAVDGTIYVAGGLDSGGSSAQMSAYVVGEGRWEHPLAALPAKRDHGAGAAVSGLLYAIGGRDGTALTGRVDIYDPDADQWTSGAPMITARSGVATAVAGGAIYVFGGENLDASSVFSESEVYDPAADAWRSLAPMLTPRHGMGAAAVGGRIYVPGGATSAGFGATDVHEVFIPAP